MTSLGCKVDESVNPGNGPYVFKSQGCLSHLAGSLLLQEGESPVYAQLYIYNPAEALDHRIQHEANRGLNRQVMADLQDMLYCLHPTTQMYKQAYEITREMPNHQQCRIALRYDKECDQQRYNLPTCHVLSWRGLPEGRQSGAKVRRKTWLQLVRCALV
jgi:hypothetical protein